MPIEKKRLRTSNPVTVPPVKEPWLTYRIKKIEDRLPDSATLDENVWRVCRPLHVTNYNHWSMEFKPETVAKLCYDDTYIHVLFQVKDNYIRCLTTELNGEVWKDACVEFFFSPEGSKPGSYFNLEINCGGAIRLGHQGAPDTDGVLIREEHACKIKISHSLPELIEKEIKGPTTWSVEIAMPFEILQNYSTLRRPRSGSKWRANFYKCAENNSHPHWLSWAPIVSPSPNFHLPQFFGDLEFE